MAKVDIANPINISKLHLEIKEKIFEDIRNRRIFGKICLWQNYMIIEFYNKFPKNLREQIDLVIENLVNENVFELSTYGYKLTSSGEDLIYDCDYYNINTIIEKILVYFRDNDYYENYRWPVLTAMAFSKTLTVYEERLFNAAINEMLQDRLLDYDESRYSYIITKKCQQRMFGLE